MRALSMLLTNDLMKGRRINDVSINNILLFFHSKLMDSILPWVCSVIDHLRVKTWKEHLFCDTICIASGATFFVVPTTFWYHMWSITEQRHGNMEYICWLDVNYQRAIHFVFSLRMFVSAHVIITLIEAAGMFTNLCLVLLLLLATLCSILS